MSSRSLISSPLYCNKLNTTIFMNQAWSFRVSTSTKQTHTTKQNGHQKDYEKDWSPLSLLRQQPITKIIRIFRKFMSIFRSRNNPCAGFGSPICKFSRQLAARNSGCASMIFRSLQSTNPSVPHCIQQFHPFCSDPQNSPAHPINWWAFITGLRLLWKNSI